MASIGCTYWTHSHESVGKVNFSLCVSETNADVSVSLTISETVVSLDAQYDWKMNLQRKVNGVWETIGTRTGYVATKSASHRTFTNVGHKNAEMRVQVYTYYGGTNMREHTGTKYSNHWTR